MSQKSYDHTCNNTLARVNNGFLKEIMFILKAINPHFKGSNDKQNLTLVVISYEIYEIYRRLVS